MLPMKQTFWKVRMETFISRTMTGKMEALHDPQGGPAARGHPKAGSGPKVWKYFTPKASTASNFWVCFASAHDKNQLVPKFH